MFRFATPDLTKPAFLIALVFSSILVACGGGGSSGLPSTQVQTGSPSPTVSATVSAAAAASFPTLCAAFDRATKMIANVQCRIRRQGDHVVTNVGGKAGQSVAVQFDNSGKPTGATLPDVTGVTFQYVWASLQMLTIGFLACLGRFDDGDTREFCLPMRMLVPRPFRSNSCMESFIAVGNKDRAVLRNGSPYKTDARQGAPSMTVRSQQRTVSRLAQAGSPRVPSS